MYENDTLYLPKLSIPKVNCISPESSVNNTAIGTLASKLFSLALLLITDAVSRDNMAVGPRVTSLLVPKNVYTKTPIKDE